MQNIYFQVPEYQSDGSFCTTEYRFQGDEDSGWMIIRNGRLHQELGRGYVPVRTRYCGVCSTDLARRFLPYSLPQIIGHEVVGEYGGRPVVVEINASHKALGRGWEDCPWCASGWSSQCPERITLGIDRLPGGFAPWLLAPRHAVVPIPEGIDPLVAGLTEPLAAALRGVEVTRPRDGERTAVLGPRRLGALCIAALAGFRTKHGTSFTITALTRHAHLGELSMGLGADEVADPSKGMAEGSFDIVFDTTGTPDGFELALRLAKRAVHLKSTHGRSVMGLSRLSDLVVEEQAILPCRLESLDFHWPCETEAGFPPRTNPNVYVSPSVPKEMLRGLAVIDPHRFHRLPPNEAWFYLQQPGGLTEGSPLPRFDLAIAGSLGELDTVIRPVGGSSGSLLRPGGAVMLVSNETNPLTEAVCRQGLVIHSSRCGDFRPALEIIANNPSIAAAMRESMITHRFPLNRLADAFKTAGDSRKSIKVMVEVTAPSGRERA
ncbi:MAG: alcohol dehydrogenase catalytic domain-containing protein [Acidobacteriota bacterium]|nr:alcohol dehydrogenase catalytic domain-containing protein [Acidobacteriota bacterium]